MSYKYDYLVFIGRFQPFHAGHKTVIDKALELSEKVIVVLGSYNQPRTFRNPWNVYEREQMIRKCYPDQEHRLDFAYQEDYTYNLDKWVASIQGQVNHIIHKIWRAGPIKIGLIGHAKDHSSYYLKLFPTWDSEDVTQEIILDATKIREDFFHPYVDGLFPSDSRIIPSPVVNYLEQWKSGFEKEYEIITQERKHLLEYAKQWSHSPYPPTFVTTDAVVVQSGHILMVKRGAMPGKGQWALPGGFLGTYESTEDSMIRELREETKIKVPDPVLRGSIKDYRVYDDPYRSQRGRTITHAYFIHLTNETELPKVKGSDDAAKAKWIPLGEIDRSMVFEDHYDIIHDLVNL